MHGSTLAVRHAALTTEELGEDAGDGAAAEDGEGVAAVGGDDEVFGCDGVFNADGDGFLYSALIIWWRFKTLRRTEYAVN